MSFTPVSASKFYDLDLPPSPMTASLSETNRPSAPPPPPTLKVEDPPRHCVPSKPPIPRRESKTLRSSNSFDLTSSGAPTATRPPDERSSEGSASSSTQVYISQRLLHHYDPIIRSFASLHLPGTYSSPTRLSQAQTHL
jgi:hypothetical protein